MLINDSISVEDEPIHFISKADWNTTMQPFHAGDKKSLAMSDYIHSIRKGKTEEYASLMIYSYLIFCYLFLNFLMEGRG